MYEYVCVCELKCDVRVCVCVCVCVRWRVEEIVPSYVKVRLLSFIFQEGEKVTHRTNETHKNLDSFAGLSVYDA